MTVEASIRIEKRQIGYTGMADDSSASRVLHSQSAEKSNDSMSKLRQDNRRFEAINGNCEVKCTDRFEILNLAESDSADTAIGIMHCEDEQIEVKDEGFATGDGDLDASSIHLSKVEPYTGSSPDSSAEINGYHVEKSNTDSSDPCLGSCKGEITEQGTKAGVENTELNRTEENGEALGMQVRVEEPVNGCCNGEITQGIVADFKNSDVNGAEVISVNGETSGMHVRSNCNTENVDLHRAEVNHTNGDTLEMQFGVEEANNHCNSNEIAEQGTNVSAEKRDLSVLEASSADGETSETQAGIVEPTGCCCNGDITEQGSNTHVENADPDMTEGNQADMLVEEASDFSYSAEIPEQATNDSIEDVDLSTTEVNTTSGHATDMQIGVEEASNYCTGQDTNVSADNEDFHRTEAKYANGENADIDRIEGNHMNGNTSEMRPEVEEATIYQCSGETTEQGTNACIDNGHINTTEAHQVNGETSKMQLGVEEPSDCHCSSVEVYNNGTVENGEVLVEEGNVFSHEAKDSKLGLCPGSEDSLTQSQVQEFIGENTAPSAALSNSSPVSPDCQNEENEPTATVADTLQVKAVDDSSASSSTSVTCADVAEEPFRYLIKMPRYENEMLRKQTIQAQQQLEEKTQARDAIRAEIQKTRATCKELHEKFENAMLEERSIRDELKQKRQEIDSVQGMLNKVKDVESSREIGRRIQNLEHKIEHESLPLKEEKQCIREIKQLKNLHDQLRSSIDKQDDIKQALEDRDELENQAKILKKDADGVKNRLSIAEAATKDCNKIYFEERQKLNELQARHKAADEIRQEAYLSLQALRKQFYDKCKHFRMYKNEIQEAYQLAAVKNLVELDRFCRNQVERIMKLWNEDEEFRNEYIKCNMKSTIRRLKMGDNLSLSLASNEERTESTNMMSKHVPVVDESAPPIGQENPSEKEPEIELKKKVANKVVMGTAMKEAEGEEAKERRKEEEIRLKEQRRMEEKEKAKRAEERKRKKAGKAKAIAEFKAQKEAEVREKEREKRARKQERKKAREEHSEGWVELAPKETPKESPIEEEVKIVKNQPKRRVKQTNYTPVPLPLRNKGKRGLQQWMWIALALLSILAFLLITLNMTSPQRFFPLL